MRAAISNRTALLRRRESRERCFGSRHFKGASFWTNYECSQPPASKTVAIIIAPASSVPQLNEFKHATHLEPRLAHKKHWEWSPAILVYALQYFWRHAPSSWKNWFQHSCRSAFPRSAVKWHCCLSRPYAFFGMLPASPSYITLNNMPLCSFLLFHFSPSRLVCNAPPTYGCRSWRSDTTFPLIAAPVFIPLIRALESELLRDPFTLVPISAHRRWCPLHSPSFIFNFFFILQAFPSLFFLISEM